MHESESGKEESIPNFLGTSNHPLYLFEITNIVYWRNIISHCPTNEKAKEDIKKFISL